MNRLAACLLVLLAIPFAVSCDTGPSIEETNVPPSATEKSASPNPIQSPTEPADEEATQQDVAEEPTLKPEPAPSLESIASATAEEGLDLILELGPNTQLFINGGGLEPGSSVEFREVPEAEWREPPPQHSQTGKIYEVNAEGQTASLSATITLGIDDTSLATDEFDDIRIAYYHEGSWVTLPSTVDGDTRTVTTSVDHFSFFTWVKRLFNEPPEVAVDATPNIYAGVDVGERLMASLDDLLVDIYAVDPENEELRVAVSFGFEALARWAIHEMEETRRHLGEHVLIESTIEFPQTGGILGTVIREELAPPPRDLVLTTPWHELREVEPGRYHTGYQLGQLELESPLQKIFVFVRVWDDIDEDYVERTVEIPVTTAQLASPPRLKHPGPSALMLCPSQPTFVWALGSATTSKSHGFRLVKGNDVWGASPETDWFCNSEDDCSRTGPSTYFAQEWTPEEPLSDGVYSWGMVASSDEAERDFKSELSTRSNIYQFTVDSSLTGNECITRDVLSPNWVDLAVDGTTVKRSEVIGSGEYVGLKWLASRGDEKALDIFIHNEYELDASQVGVLGEGERLVWVEGVYEDFLGNRTTKRISNKINVPIEVEEEEQQISTTTDTGVSEPTPATIDPNFYARYQSFCPEETLTCRDGNWQLQSRPSWDTCPVSIELILQDTSSGSVTFLETGVLEEPQEIKVSPNLLPEEFHPWSPATLYWMPITWPTIDLPASETTQTAQFAPTGTTNIGLSNSSQLVPANIYQANVQGTTNWEECGTIAYSSISRNAYDISTGLLIRREHTLKYENDLSVQYVIELVETNQSLSSP